MKDKLTLARSVGNISIVLGYIVLLNVNIFWGLLIKLLAACLVVPWAVKYKFWDVVALNGFMSAVDLHKLIVLLFFI